MKRGVSRWRTRWAVAALAPLLFAACGTGSGPAEQEALDAENPRLLEPPGSAGDPAEADEPGQPTVDEATPAPWTRDVVRRSAEVQGVVTLDEIRVAPNHGFDRVVFQFREEEIPEYRIEYIDGQALDCGQGTPVPVQGTRVLVVRLTPARGHDEDGTSTIEERNLESGLEAIRQVRAVCDFEAHLDWAIGVAGHHRFRVMELTRPARLVVDVRTDG